MITITFNFEQEQDLIAGLEMGEMHCSHFSPKTAARLKQLREHCRAAAEATRVAGEDTVLVLDPICQRRAR